MPTTGVLKNKVLIAATAIFFILSSVMLALSFYTPTSAAGSAAEQTKRTINVSGQGTVKVAPDIAYITLGVLTENANAKIAQQENAKSMAKVITEIKAAGIKNEDIKTVGYSIYPKYDYNKETGLSNIVGYSVNNSIQVTVRDITKTGNIIDLASDAGVNVSNSISFELSDYEKYYNEALKAAVSNAKKRAQTIGTTIGVSLKTPVIVTESGGYSPPVIYGGYAMKADMAAESTPVQGGTLEVRATVSMVYEY